MTVISRPTIEVLKNFCSINKSIVIKPGNTLSTLSINKNILAIADVQEQFDSQISIYDLSVFLGGLSLFNAPKVDTSHPNFVTVSDERGKSKTRFFYADPDIITQPPEKEITLPSVDCDFALSAEVLQQLLKAASVYQLPDLCLFGHEGAVQIMVTDKKNDTSNSYSVDLPDAVIGDEEFCFCFKVENLRLLPGAYHVMISKQNVAEFRGDGIKYFIALEPNN
ncbi:sliding clamp DNA polymerase accessory protein [Cyanophage S-RIM12_RW_29_1109]|jgi:hypothetical protein|uniref:Sliding clamp n=5 Tax=Brizovirus TaxID=2733098 RepID=A0A1D7SPN0_9CAUD|nr:DNA polymerase processivity factor [Prochlorococcus phage Syn33]YP_009779120.1 DNA polymerase processivity factor [Cyanophage S-RIM12 isolate RW_01_0310]AOO15200.1 sliding clamp DNA polymerase accessory protein [Cyanophage S-RIM12_Np_14_0310]AOO15627.1 sliding clamp DNA polymerase accessory protein [Cyanophage S-RIM12_Np_22_1112]AOO16268.1 sliding clamp DNA polymerase accessory protein [Cyanophage S-RIM12_RW_04_0709]AOO16699.1 sliding clamp DNA polymerase accessory protein [Cyanophage S-RIM|tara:strand:- start:1553 stop:2221 length:669 start_codon:yes stop_codon:yes gene_type:complete